MREVCNLEGRSPGRTDRSAIEVVGTSLVDSAIKVHQALGPGLLESSYQECLAHELRSRGFNVQCEVELPVRYNSMRIDVGYRVDMIIEDLVIVENKTVERLLPVHSAQVLTYLRMSGCRLGYLLNWFVPLMRDGIRRLVDRL
jgi:GxxExxY protein